MDKKELLINEFNIKFIKGNTYKTAEIEDFLKNNNNATLKQAAAYAYNRWNKGMGDIFPIFEWLQLGEYRYLGWKYEYTGNIYHYPQGDIPYAIGKYLKGEFTFDNEDILNFSQWKRSDDNGFKVVVLNSRVTFTSLDGTLVQNRILTNNSDLKGKSIDGFDYLLFESKLGQLLMNKRIGDAFIFGTIKYKVEEIV